MGNASYEKSINHLYKGKVSVHGEFLWGSNYTFLAQVDLDGESLPAVYKPTRGERPLWDFPTATLARREVAAYQVSEALGWELVPPTIYKMKGPLGPGSLQLYIEHDPEYHYFNFTEADRQRLRPVVLFDLLINNADRKGSHVLIEKGNHHMWLIDHGICFHEEDKLRTVIWDFVGETIPENLCADLSRLRKELMSPNNKPSPLAEEFQANLSESEVKAMITRIDHLISSAHFPSPNPYRRPYPWPQI